MLIDSNKQDFRAIGESELYFELLHLVDFFQLTFHLTDSQQPDLTCPQNITQGTDDMQPNARVYWNILATDNSGQDPNISCSPSSGSMFDLGTTFVECNATDFSQNTISCSFHVNIVGKLFSKSSSNYAEKSG